jgi:hydroxyacylglutathione hydrolase
LKEVPNDRPVTVICGSGYRGSIATLFLKNHGYRRAANALGGMSAWAAARLPTVK